MASSKPDHLPPEDLTRCGICKSTIIEPKALPCLHTFCLECLRKWIKSRESITCPILACKKTTPMPSDGVDGLPGNVFVSSLVKISPSRSKHVPCACCEETDNVVVARCLDCNGFLCQQGVDQHRMRLLRSHQVVKLEDIKSGKVDVSMLTGKKRPTCEKHEGQQLWFYCETCGDLICRDCTVLNHWKPKHKYVDLENIVADQRRKIQHLLDKTGNVENKIEKAIKDVTKTKEEESLKVECLNTDVENTKETIKTHVEAIISTMGENLRKQITHFEVNSKKKIRFTEETLQSQKLQLQTAKEMAKQVLLIGSDYDVASMYKQLSSSLEELCEMQPASVPQALAYIKEFKADTEVIKPFTGLGNLIYSPSWVLETAFGSRDGPEKLSLATSISTTPTGDFAVTDYKSSNTPVKVYSSDGQFTFCLDERSSNAWNVVVSPAGQFYVATHEDKYVTEYGSDGRYLSQFAARSPANVSSDTDRETQLRGLAISSKQQLLVGNCTSRKYISIHELSGEHIKSIHVNIDPDFIATTPQGIIIVSPNLDGGGVHVLNSDGILLHTINSPQCVREWHPEGVCYSASGEICISNSGEPKGIYCFSSTGVYLKRLCKQVDNPCGIALSQNDEKLIVADGSCVRVFRRKRSAKELFSWGLNDRHPHISQR